MELQVSILLAYRTDALEPTGTIPLHHLLSLREAGCVVGVIGEVWESVQLHAPALNFYTRAYPTLTDKLRSLAHSLTPRPLLKLYVGVEEERGMTLDAGWHFCLHTEYEVWKGVANPPDPVRRNVTLLLDAYARIKECVVERFPSMPENQSHTLTEVLLSLLVRGDHSKLGVSEVVKALNDLKSSNFRSNKEEHSKDS